MIKVAASKSQFEREIFQQNSLFTQPGMGNQLSSELGKVKAAVKKRSAAPPQFQCWQN